MRSGRPASRNTIQRQLVLTALGDLNIHATAEQVYDRVSTMHPSISKATVYRNLGRLAETGAIANIGSFDGATHYDHRLHRHYHFVCDSCGRIFDVSGDISGLCDEIEDTDGHEVRGHSLNFAGVCRDCRGKTDAGLSNRTS